MLPVKSSRNFLTEVIGQQAAILSATEVGLGSLLYSFHVPLTGHFLSLNQALLLSRTTRILHEVPHSSLTAAKLSTVSALLKSLAPAGKKLSPMLAIATQGCFFSFGTFLFGNNLLGSIVGSVLMSFWAFIQPLAVYLLIFGTPLLRVANEIYQKISEAFAFDQRQLVWVLLLLVIVKAVLSAGVAIMAFYMPDTLMSRYTQRLLHTGRAKIAKRDKVEISSPYKAALKDLLNPLFIISLVLTLVFFLYSESSHATIVWGILRPMAIGYLVFLFLRIAPVESWSHRLEKTWLKGLVPVLKIASRKLREF